MIEDDDDFNTGKVLFMDAPRLMHPPMDIILAIDFVLGNFYSRTKRTNLKELLDDDEYKKIINRSKERFWKPYYFGLASNFTVDFAFMSISHISSNRTFAQNLILHKKEH